MFRAVTWVGLLALAANGVAQNGTKVSSLGWLAGTWTATMDGNTAERTCSAPAGGSMMCMMRVIAEQKAVWLEFSIMRETESGVTLDTRFYTGDEKPADPVAVQLRLKSATSDEVVFENPGGTQPKSESVRRTGRDQMKSHAELVDAQGKTSTMDIAWTRVTGGP